jgi:hypothetical protein
MELNFDKEMDALLRQAAQQEKPVQPATPAHLDADELAAFARNALPVAARTRAMEHLVDCGNCRTILSNLVFFENQTEENSARPLVAAAVTQTSLLDSIKAFFTMPTLAYGMAGLVLVFAGLLVFTIVNNSRQEATSVAKANDAALEKPLNAKGAPVDNDLPAAMANSNSSVSAANAATAANTTATGAFSPFQGGVSNSASNMGPTDPVMGKTGEEQELKLDDKTEAAKEATANLSAAKPAEAQPVTRQQQDYMNRQRNENLDEIAKSKDNYRQNNNILTPDGSDQRGKRSIPPPPPPPASSAGSTAVRDAVRGDEDADKNSPASPARKTVKGKQFRRDGNVWVDTAYRGQATVNIVRESKEFKKLDGDVKKIARELAGTVIVVWKDTAYRIQ